MRAIVIGAVGLLTVGFIVARRSTVRGRPHAPKATPKMHAEARSLANDAFSNVIHVRPLLDELLMLLAVALHETTFGYGWKGAGGGSFNMGGIQADRSWMGETFPATDTHPTSSGGAVPYDQAFRKYSSALEGWEDLVRELYVRRSSVRKAAATGDPMAVAKAMRKTRYYEGQGATEADRIRGYAQALADSLWEIERQGGVQQ